MENLTFNIVVFIIAILLIAFIASQKKLQRKRESIVIIIGVTAMVLVSNPLIWIPIWLVLVIYLLVKKTT
ncbi:hypothetical protein [Paraliobacillus sediminis]|uniref:hypothetical protein n=1 Tax=Paraliobacillus sediminis TaxID=1885916 RepID=UPI000E3B96C8|nr:hypothetical protein [Paraliobacillus sediminis]